MRNRRLWSRLAILAVVVGAVVVARFTVFAPKPIPVRTVGAETGRVEETVTNSRAGTVKARRRAKLAPEIGGKVLRLPHRRGAEVRAGDLLLRVDDALQRARLVLAEDDRQAALAQRDQVCLAAERAAREQARTAELAGENIVSMDLLDRVESHARATAAACRAAQAVAQRAGSAVALAKVDEIVRNADIPVVGVGGIATAEDFSTRVVRPKRSA